MVHLELPDNWQDLATGYVLNNLSEEEAWIWEMLLQEYPELYQEIQQLERAFNGLAEVVPVHQPPPNLLQKIHTTIDAQQNPPAQQSNTSTEQSPPSTLGLFSSASERQPNGQSMTLRRLSPRSVQPLLQQPRLGQSVSSERVSQGSQIVQIGGVIAAGIVVVLGLQIQRLQNQLQRTGTELQQAKTQIRSLNRQLRQAESFTQYTRPVVQTLQQPESLIYSLAGSNLANTASGRLVMSEEQQVMIVVQNLPQLPEGKVYRLWAALQTKDVVYCGQFNSNAEGIIRLTPSSEHCGENPSQMIITLDAITDPTTQGGPVVMQSSI